MSTPSVLDLAGRVPDAEDLDPVAAHLHAGGLVAYPTETVYGFGGLCTPDAVERVRALKRRTEDRPLLVVLRSAEDAAGLAWNEAARELASVFWPGAVTLVLADPRGTFPTGVRSPEGTVAVRVSPHPLVAALLERVGAPLTSTSANAPGEAPARSGGEALRAARLLGAGAEMLVVEAGPLPPSGPSTIVDCSGENPLVLREGTVPTSRLRCVLPDLHAR